MSPELAQPPDIQVIHSREIDLIGLPGAAQPDHVDLDAEPHRRHHAAGSNSPARQNAA
ncbi:hypothetical protein [Pseudonocardia humida]|uniref:Uncharacterized protein n=1 Tax=Pseudonocardia humida TaxID=2800819 RepID=A0ABT1AB01_9PSEU|nr:hypothetical protein [Pseudonocardia humida]MCO1660178.1 hypothetical protein [Pseudonocardia humida]